MQRELQQKIIGYYIEETKNNLSTIEQLFLRFHNRLDECLIIEDLVCASNSLTSGSAMLGVESISRTSCFLKSCFQVLQLEGSVKIDQKLKDLFMEVFCALKELVEHLGHSSELSNVRADIVMSEIEPVMGDLKNHLDWLIKRSYDDTIAVDDELISLFDDFLLDNSAS